VCSCEVKHIKVCAKCNHEGKCLVGAKMEKCDKKDSFFDKFDKNCDKNDTDYEKNDKYEKKDKECEKKDDCRCDSNC